MIAATKIKSTRLSNRHTFYCALLILIYLSVAVAIAVEWQSKLTQHFMLDPVVFVSLGYFLVLLAASWKSLKVFYVLTPLVVLSVPNAVNDLFPSYAMGPTDERGASYFAFFTHIDIFVLFGLIVHGMRRELRPLYTLEVLGLSFLALCYFVGYVQALLGPERRLGVYAVWGFQYRYVFLAMAFVFLPTLGGRRNGFILAGLYVTALLVVTESVLFTELRLGGVFSHRLTSGNYGHNGYGNLLAAISASCYIQYCLTAKVSRRLRWILLILFTVFTSAAFFF